METNIKRKMNDALKNIANIRSMFGGWLVCNHLMCENITFSIYKTGYHEEPKTITIDEVGFTYYAGTTESDIMPIALKIIDDIKEVEL